MRPWPTDAEIRALHEHRDDPDEWEEEPVQIPGFPPTGNVVTFPIPSEELDRLIAFAEERDETISQVILDSLRLRFDGWQPEPEHDEVVAGVA